MAKLIRTVWGAIPVAIVSAFCFFLVASQKITGNTLRACLKSRRVWIGEWIFCPARQKSAGILTDGKDF